MLWAYCTCPPAACHDGATHPPHPLTPTLPARPQAALGGSAAFLQLCSLVDQATLEDTSTHPLTIIIPVSTARCPLAAGLALPQLPCHAPVLA